MSEDKRTTIERAMSAGRRWDRAVDHKDTNPKDAAATTRLDLSLFPDTAAAYGALALTEGDLKYGGYNYRVKGISVSTYIAALRRHTAKYFNGEWADPFTDIPHLASMLACVAIIIDCHEKGILNDDRPPSVDMGNLLDEFQARVELLQQLFPPENRAGPRYRQDDLNRGSTQPV